LAEGLILFEEESAMDDFTYGVGSGDETEDWVLIGRGAEIVKIPADHWKGHVAAATERISKRLDFMTEEHHLVRRYAVKEIAERVRPLTEAEISRQTRLPRPRVHQILNELEARLFFLARDSTGRVTWAYPFTSDQTPHRVLRDARRPARAA
jgi:hypothetical protein